VKSGKKKVVIIGLDGVPFEMMENFSRKGVMPNTSRLLSQSVFKKVNSTIPEVSSVAWSSIITGKNPAEHGIFGFTDLHCGTYQLRFPNFSELKSPPFWEIWPLSSVIINVPSTYPVRPMNGVHISGFVSIDFKKSVYPTSLIPKLKELDYRLDVDSQKAHESLNLFLDDLDRTLDARINSFRYLWENTDWQVFMPVFTGTDRLMHFLFDAYQQPDHKYHNIFCRHFEKIDNVIGEIASEISDDTLLVILSDHGFELLEKEVYINYLLMQAGFLQFQKDSPLDLTNICYGTKAFVLDPARIYLNLKGKFPCGTLEDSQAEQVLCELENLFASLEVDGKKVIKDIYRKKQIYSGQYFDDAPDLVLVAAEGFDLKAKLRIEQLTGKGIFTGKHTQDTAFFIIRGLEDESIVPQAPVVWDMVSIVEKELSF